MSSVQLYTSDEFRYEIDPDAHAVERPGRARMKFRHEARSEARRIVGDFAAGSLVFLVFVLLLSISIFVQITFPRIASLMFVASTLLGFIVGSFILYGILAAGRIPIDIVRVRLKGSATPRMDSPEETLITFFASIADNLYGRAFNCLTDTAHVLSLSVTKRNTLERVMPDLEFNSIQSLGQFWSGIQYYYKPVRESMKIRYMGEETALITMDILATWKAMGIEKASYEVLSLYLSDSSAKSAAIEVNQDNEEFINPSHSYGETRRAQMTCPFLFVRRGGFWFLCNGFFWPAQYTTLR